MTSAEQQPLVNRGVAILVLVVSFGGLLLSMTMSGTTAVVLEIGSIAVLAGLLVLLSWRMYERKVAEYSAERSGESRKAGTDSGSSWGDLDESGGGDTEATTSDRKSLLELSTTSYRLLFTFVVLILLPIAIRVDIQLPFPGGSTVVVPWYMFSIVGAIGLYVSYRFVTTKRGYG